MKNEAPIDVETVDKPSENTSGAPQMAIAKFEGGGAVGRALTVKELHERLEFVRQIMKQEMREGQDFGKIPGTGDKPSLLQPGAQKLLMTFNLREQVKRELLREFSNMQIQGHREYEFTVTVFPSGLDSGNGWDGVGTCSTLESKYRYRKQERRCPACGKEKIIQGKAEFGGGWLCWKKKGGCGATFKEDDKRIADQEAGTVEYENPADYWNTVRKMAFKRAIVHAAINATNTSELWTQDVEEMAQNAENAPKVGKAPTPPPRPAAPTTPPQQTAPPGNTTLVKNVQTDKPWAPTAKTRDWVLGKIEKAGLTNLALEYFRKLDKPSVLLPTEGLKDIPLRFIPNSQDQLLFLLAAITDFGNGDECKHAFAPNELPGVPAPGSTPAKAAAAVPPPKPAAAAPPPQPPAKKPVDNEYWRDIIVPIPNKGQKRGDYIVNPDTIGSLYDQCKSGTPEACKRLWGFVSHFEPKPWTGRDNQQHPPSDTDLQFRKALDDFKDWHDKYGKDTQVDPATVAETPDPLASADDEETPFDRL